MSSTLKGKSPRNLLIIFDGLGIRDEIEGNAFQNALTPTFDSLFSNHPFTTLKASEHAVGLPKGISGNSEVGHINIGSGRRVQQDIIRINTAIKNHTLASMSEYQNLIQHTEKSSKRLHLLILCSDGGVHSHLEHLLYIVNLVQSESQDINIFLHLFTDGRDTPTTSSLQYIASLPENNRLKIASVQGRYYGMDRDNRWERIQKSYDTMTGKTSCEKIQPLEYIKKMHRESITDEFIIPALFRSDYAIQSSDSAFFLNFRPDRAREITLALCDPNFPHFNNDIRPSFFLCMSPYVDDELLLPILFDKEKVRGGLGEYLSKRNLRQFRIAETEKFAHVTYFFNGGQKEPFENEDRALIPSPQDITTYDQKPEMSAKDVTAKLLQAMEDDYDFLLVNYANLDMVGHTGNFEAAKKACAFLDGCLEQLVNKAKEKNIGVFVTADHGNCDQMFKSSESDIHTAHTNSPVPFCFYHPCCEKASVQIAKHEKSLQDIAPSILYVMGLDIPKDYTGLPIFL